ncbi:MAG: hypothetical protein HQ472_08085 [Ignavibacteria bacterium]|nr:hypothetical protein [Ignavibacteria bacterium]
MAHILVAIVTMGFIWFAWINFRLLGRVRASDAHLTDEEKAIMQSRYMTRIILCLVSLAAIPFIFGYLTEMSL